MRCALDGEKISDVRSFACELAKVVSFSTGTRADFGWELHSLNDHLQGGYGGQPPYEIVVENAEAMVRAMGHEGLQRYCEDMLEVIASGGRGMVQRDGREWYSNTRARAKDKSGCTLLDLLFETIESTPARLTLLSESGEVLRESRARKRVS